MRIHCPNCNAIYRKAYTFGRVLICKACDKAFIAGDALPQEAPSGELHGDLLSPTVEAAAKRGKKLRPTRTKPAKERIPDDARADST